jgi:hypothetical protein
MLMNLMAGLRLKNQVEEWAQWFTPVISVTLKVAIG